MSVHKRDSAEGPFLEGHELGFVLLNQFGKVTEGSVIGFFRFIGKTAGRQLLLRHVMGDACAAGSLARAWLIGAVALLHIFIFIAVHGVSSYIFGLVGLFIPW